MADLPSPPKTNTVGVNDQWLRKASLVVSTGDSGEDLSALRFTFLIKQCDVETPNIAMIRVYNLSTEKRAKVIREYTRVTLSAGYQQGRFGIIFDGTIKQFRKGRESNIDSYLDIFAADGDLAHLFGMISKTLPAGENGPEEQLEALNDSVEQYGVSAGDQNGLSGGILPRGKVLYGMWQDHMRGLANNSDVGWSVVNGKIQVVPNKGALPSGQALKLNSLTGMVGVPEATDQGIMVKCLLNPSIQIYSQVQINNADINQTIHQGATASGPNPAGQTFPGFNTLPQLFADVTNDGLYRVLVVEHEGDSRGNPWYTSLVCLAMDRSTKDGPQTTDQNTPLPPDTFFQPGTDKPLPAATATASGTF